MRIKIRRAVQTDWPFIFKSYLTNRWFSSENDTTLRKNTWMKLHHAQLEALLTSTPPLVLTACSEEDEDFIFGYVVLGTKHFAYVKKDFRDADVNIKSMLEKAADKAMETE